MRNLMHMFILLMLGVLVVVPSLAQDEPLQVLVSHSILADVVAQVAGNAADVVTLMPRGADPHSFQPTPSDLTQVVDADVVFVNGAFFEEGVLDAIETIAENTPIVSASICVSLIVGGEHGHEDGDEDDHAHEDEDDHDEEHRDEDEHDHEDENGDEGDDTGCEAHQAEVEAIYPNQDADGKEQQACADGEPCDPHVWMEPRNVMLWTVLIRDTLSDLDPANADTYHANADAYLAELDVLVQDTILPLVASIPPEDRVLVTNHDSLGYFAANYEFEVVGAVIPGGSTVVEPSSADVAAVIDLIREREVPAIFAEVTVSDSLANQIATETDAEVYVLYSGSLSADDELASTYLEYMRYNITTIVAALGGRE